MYMPVMYVGIMFVCMFDFIMRMGMRVIAVARYFDCIVLMIMMHVIMPVSVLVSYTVMPVVMFVLF